MTTDTKDRPSAAELMALVDAYAETAAVNGIRSQWAQMARGKVELALKQLPAPQAQADARDALTPAARDVLAERARQISAEGRTSEHDDDYRGEELALGAAWYATPTFTRNTLEANDMSLWPVSWADSWFKPGDRRRELTKAGALVLAAIERIDRAAIAAAKGE